MHQLLLVGTVSHGNYTQTISTLQALTGIISPQLVSTYALICKPINKFRPKFEPGKVNQIEQHYMKCTTTWDDFVDFDLSNPIDEGSVATAKLFDGARDGQRTWTLQISDIPIAGKNQTCSAQTIYESTLVHNHISTARAQRQDSFIQFLNDLGYDFTNQYWVKGVRFFHGDIVIEIFKVFIRDNLNKGSDKIPLKLLDDSNSFQIKAFINIPRSTDIDLINQGARELQSLQDFLKNLFELEIPDRIYMDSRVST